jgi:hypothetical protein
VDSTEPEKKRISYKKENQGLLHDPISSPCHSKLGHSFILHHSDEFIHEKGTLKRLLVTRTAIVLEMIVQELDKHVQDCTSELVFNLDEVRISDWEDRQLRRIVAVEALSRETIHYGISQDVKYISVTACIFVAAQSLVTHIITSEDSSPIQE